MLSELVRLLLIVLVFEDELHDGVDEEDNDADGVDGHEDAHGAALTLGRLVLGLDPGASHRRPHPGHRSGL